jgi:hypothetical protein
VEVISFKGNGGKKSGTFHLSGNDAKLVYKYKSEMADMGVFVAYVVDKGVDIMKQGGMPEVTTSKSDEGESSIQKSAGDYYLNINATGNWTVSVMELQ